MMLSNLMLNCHCFCLIIGDLCWPNLDLILEVLIILSLVGVTGLGLGIVNLHSFLAKNAPVVADVLVVEGWIPDYAIEAAMTEFQNGSYRTLIAVGAPVPRGFYLSEYKTFAELAAATLIALEFDPQNLQVISTTHRKKHRPRLRLWGSHRQWRRNFQGYTTNINNHLAV